MTYFQLCESLLQSTYPRNYNIRQYFNNMNLKQNKQRSYHHESPIKRSQNSIQITNFYSRPNHQQQPKPSTINNYLEMMHKQNIDPNSNFYYGDNLQKGASMGIDMGLGSNTTGTAIGVKEYQNGNHRSPKRKVIHLKSVAKNSKSAKDGRSGSAGKKYSVEHIFTEVADFNQNLRNSRPIKIEIDLKNHRRSMQDTLTSSTPKPQPQQNPIICDQHPSKKATFIVKGRPYCDKCSVKLITKGFLAIKIKNQKNNIDELDLLDSGHDFQDGGESRGEEKGQGDGWNCVRNIREADLKAFIEELDRMDGVVEGVGVRLGDCLGMIGRYFQVESGKLQQNWNKLMKFLQNFKSHLLSNFKAQQQKSQRMLQQSLTKIQEQTQSLNFMRNDIVRNIHKIVDESSIPSQKYKNVMQNFQSQLQQIKQTIIKIQDHNNMKLTIPRVQFDLYRLDQEFQKCLNVKSVAEEIGGWGYVEGRKIDGEAARGIGGIDLSGDKFRSGDEDAYGETAYRLSFGKDMERMERMESPTFKLI